MKRSKRARECKFCGCPMRPRGAKKKPGKYEHAQGCPAGKVPAPDGKKPPEPPKVPPFKLSPSFLHRMASAAMMFAATEYVADILSPKPKKLWNAEAIRKRARQTGHGFPYPHPKGTECVLCGAALLFNAVNIADHCGVICGVCIEEAAVIAERLREGAM